MSWPTDGEPRFIVREHTGHRIGLAHARTGSGSLEGLSVCVLDRGYCHRVVAQWASEDEGGSTPRSTRWAAIRGRAQARADQLNAEHA